MLSNSNLSIDSFSRLLSILDSIQPWMTISIAENESKTLCQKVDVIRIDTYHSAKTIPAEVWNLLRSKPRQSNIILSSALRILHQEEDRQFLNRGQFWLVCRSKTRIDFVLSCTDGPMGPYPICIFSPHSYDELSEDFCRTRLTKLAEALQGQADRKRVFSVFAFENVSKIFADEWKKLTGLSYTPYYAAQQSHCTKDTYRGVIASWDDSSKEGMRLADEDDIRGVADLCFGFAQVSEPFVLSREMAVEEAKYLVTNRKVWVHVGKRLGAPDTIASIVAVTRESEDVSAITKVFTSPDWRQMGYARRLVSFVCETLLQTKESVVLYVGHDNKARTLYAHVGFVGLDNNATPASGVDNWLELGFEKNKVDLGHW